LEQPSLDFFTAFGQANRLLAHFFRLFWVKNELHKHFNSLENSEIEMGFMTRRSIFELTRRVTRSKTRVMTMAQERKKQERQARRRRIQRAAREVFAEKGYAKTSIERVARQASLSVGAIYLYFRSKEDLYASLLEETLEMIDSELSQIRARSDVRAADRLQAAWSFLCQWAVSDVEGTRTLRLLSQPNVRKQLSDEVAEAMSKGLTSVRDHLAAIIQQGSETGVYAATDANETASILWALFLGLLQSNDARLELELEGASFTETARAALTALEAGLRRQAAKLAA
jgi:AcrR family transcriptional regulator